MSFMFKIRERRRCGRRNGLIARSSVLNDDGVAACGVLRIFMARKAVFSLSAVSRDSAKPTKVIAEQENK